MIAANATTGTATNGPCCCNGPCPRCGFNCTVQTTTTDGMNGEWQNNTTTWQPSRIVELAPYIEFVNHIIDDLPEPKEPESLPIQRPSTRPTRLIDAPLSAPSRPSPIRWPSWPRPPPRSSRPPSRVASTINLNMSAPLNPRQLKFVERYIATNNAAQSYIDAGYKARGHAAESAANRLLKNVEVKKLLNMAETKATKKIGVTAEWVLRNMQKLATFRGKGWSHAAAVKATELLGRTHNLFPEKQQHEHSGPNGEPIPHEHSVTSRIDALADAFVAAARREETSPLPGDGSGKPVDS